MTRIEPGQEDQKGIQGILNGGGLGFRYSGLVDARFNFVSGFLHRLLCEIDLGYRTELVLTVLRELATNCSKAHAKRIYFAASNLSIGDSEEYSKGIQSFRENVLARWDQFLAQNAGNEYYIELSFELSPDSLIIHMENNAELLPAEWERINQRRARAARIKDILEAFNSFDDDNEGAGLGIVFVSLLLRNAGIPDSNLIIESRRGITRQSLIIPRTSTDVRNQIGEAIVRELNALPSLPDRVQQLVDLCNNSSASIGNIAQEIQKDPSMSAQILRLVHSAGFITRRKKMDLESAVKVIGLEEVAQMVLTTAGRSVLANHFQLKELESIWDASNRISFFAGSMAERAGVTRNEAAIGGLLCELGKIVMAAMEQDRMEQIERMLGSGRVRTSSILEESVIGISHAEIGARLAEQWSFPASIVSCIRFQHKPLLAPGEHEAVVRVVSLAGRMQESKLGLADYYTVDPELLRWAGISSVESFEKRVDVLHSEYEKQEA